jgi:hypothetical protein
MVVNPNPRKIAIEGGWGGPKQKIWYLLFTLLFSEYYGVILVGLGGQRSLNVKLRSR